MKSPHSRPIGGKTPQPKAPNGYTLEARRLWEQVITGWDLDPPALVVLDQACRALQRVREAQQLLARDGLVLKDRFDQSKPNPAAAIERDAQQTLLRSLRFLNLDLEPLRDRVGRPGGA